MKKGLWLVGIYLMIGLCLLSGCTSNNSTTTIPADTPDTLEGLSDSAIKQENAARFVTDLSKDAVKQISVFEDSITVTSDIDEGWIQETDPICISSASFDVVIDHEEFSYLLDVITEDNMDEIVAEFYHAVSGRILGLKTGIRGVEMRISDAQDGFDANDFTDMVLMRDGVVVNNRLTLKSGVNQGALASREIIADAYLEFESENNEPGVYSMTGKYKGVEFTVYSKIIEDSIDNTPASPDNFLGAGIVYQSGENGLPLSVGEISFHFSGVQQSFFQSDLAGIILTLNGEIIPLNVHDHIFRYLEVGYSAVSTSYNLILKERLTTPGVYQLSGYYSEKPFELTWEIS